MGLQGFDEWVYPTNGGPGVRFACTTDELVKTCDECGAVIAKREPYELTNLQTHATWHAKLNEQIQRLRDGQMHL